MPRQYNQICAGHICPVRPESFPDQTFDPVTLVSPGNVLFADNNAEPGGVQSGPAAKNQKIFIGNPEIGFAKYMFIGFGVQQAARFGEALID